MTAGATVEKMADSGQKIHFSVWDRLSEVEGASALDLLLD